MLAKRSVILIGVLILALPLAACANGSIGGALEQAIAPDDALENNSSIFGRGENAEISSECGADVLAQLPAGFPASLCYPNAELVDIDSSSAPRAAASNSESNPEQSDATSGAPDESGTASDAAPAGETSAEADTLWATTDTSEQVRQFYQQLFDQQQWEIIQPSSVASRSTAAPLEAVKAGMRVRVIVNLPSNRRSADASDGSATPESPEPETNAGANENQEPTPPTQFELQYSGAIASTSSAINAGDRPSNSPDPGSNSDSDVGAIAPAQSFSDLAQASDDLRLYISDLAALGVLTPSASASAGVADSTTFNPNQTITRREFARWLFDANNTLFQEQPAKRIRLATATEQPAFQDLSRTNPDFGIIQGLAEAGLIPSALSGNSTTVNFRPEAPLTRADLVQWKVPLDVRRSLPTATIDAVQQTWGFQDAPRIAPDALKAILADYQNGDLSNIRRAFGYTTLLQPQKPVTRAEAAAALWYFGYQGEGVSAQDVLQSDRQPDQPQ